MAACPNCGKNFTDEKFCMSCGTNLMEVRNAVEETKEETQEEIVSPQSQQQQVTPEAAATVEQTAPQAQTAGNNEYVEKAKEISLDYVQFVKDIVKAPTHVADKLYGSSFVNGIITLILYAMFIPLTIYFTIKKIFSDIPFAANAVPFSKIFFQPFLYLVLLLAIIGGLIYVVTKPGEGNYTYKDVFARFGAFLVIPTALLLLALLSSILGMLSVIGYLLVFGLIGLFVAIPFTIYSLKKNGNDGIDPLYGTFATYIVFFIVVRLVAESVIYNNIVDSLGYLW